MCKDEIKVKVSQLMIFKAGRGIGNIDPCKYYRNACDRCDERVKRMEGNIFVARSIYVRCVEDPCDKTP